MAQPLTEVSRTIMVGLRVSTNGVISVRHSFTNAWNGAVPCARPGQHGSRGFYRAAFPGSANSAGAIFRMTSTGRFTSPLLVSSVGSYDGIVIAGRQPYPKAPTQGFMETAYEGRHR